MSKAVAIIVAAGKGERAGGGVPKQFRPLAGRPTVAHSFDALASHPRVDGVVVVIGEEQEGLLAHALGEEVPLAIVTGGETRQLSVQAGLRAAASAGFAGEDRVLIHDAARPFLPAVVIDRLLAALDHHSGAVPVLPVADTLAYFDGAMGPTVPRERLYRVQTPQAFRFDAVMEAHRAWAPHREATDDAQMIREVGYEVVQVTGDALLEKVTRAEDFAVAEARLGARSFRTGMGFDVHRLAPGEELWLGGIRIPHSHGLLGHSDADVALHALTDAVLGAIGAGDIGTHFPPSDPQWRGASSDRFLMHAAMLVREAGGRIEHVDVTIICEAPKIGPYRDAIRTRVAELLALAQARVSIKATTTERLGFTGRGEGIAAQAIATVSLYEGSI